MEQEKININKLKEQYPSFFEAFSYKLIDFVLGGKMAQKVANICVENRIFDEKKIQKIAYRVTFVIFGKMPKEKLSSSIIKEAEVNSEVAENISKSVDAIIFSQIKSLSEEEEEEKQKDSQKDNIPEKEKLVPEKPPQASTKDTYREPIE